MLDRRYKHEYLEFSIEFKVEYSNNSLKKKKMFTYE